MAIERKLKYTKDNKNLDNLIVTETDAAWIVTQFSSYFINEKIEFRERVKSLLQGEQLDRELEKISTKAKQIYFCYSDSMLESFESYILTLGNGFSTIPGSQNKFIKNKYFIDGEFEVIDLVVKFKHNSFGVQFIFSKVAEQSNLRLALNKIETLYSALKNKQIDRGLLIYISSNGDSNFTEKLKNRLKINERSPKYIHPENEYNLNYFPLIDLKEIPEKYAWCIVGLNEFVKPKYIKNMEIYSEHLDKKINIKDQFTNLNKKEPIITHKINLITSKNILDRPH